MATAGDFRFQALVATGGGLRSIRIFLFSARKMQ
jgi:hypothetical protein